MKETIARDLYGTEVVEYIGKPVLRLYSVGDMRCQLWFGVVKAKMIMGTIPEIKKFIEDNDKK